MKTQLFYLILLLSLTACATPTPSAYKAKILDEAAFKEDGLEYSNLADRDLDISYAVATASTDSIYLLVKATNISKMPIILDPSIFTLRNQANEKLAAQDPETIMNNADRSAVEAIRWRSNISPEQPVPLEPTPQMGTVLDSAKETRNYVSRNFLRKSLLRPGETARGYVLFFAEETAGKWTLINKLSPSRLSAKKMAFEVQR
jgi:hypothetical protein